MGRDPFHQPRMLPAPSNLALNPAREGAATASLGSLDQGLTTLLGKNFFLIPNLNLPSLSLEPFPLVLSLHTLVKSPSRAYEYSLLTPSFLTANFSSKHNQALGSVISKNSHSETHLPPPFLPHPAFSLHL